MKLTLNELLHITDEEKKDWTICLNNATSNKSDVGVYSLAIDDEKKKERLMKRISWKKHAGKKSSFRKIDTKYCLQFIRLDKDKKWDEWLFLGAFEVKGVNKFEDGHETYNLDPLDRFVALNERLIVRYKKNGGAIEAKIPITKLDEIAVVQLLGRKYNDMMDAFPGYNNVSLPYEELKKIIEKNDDEWRIALTNVNCVYVITDTSNGKVYIGSTYGFDGIWARWSCYVNTKGTGHNDALDEISKKDPEYPIKNFKWSILECFYTRNGNTQLILDREKHWKEVFGSRINGYNRN